MLGKFFKRASKIDTLLFDYLKSLKASQRSFYAGMQEWTSPEYKREELKFHAKLTHKHESRADDIRDEINNLMYGKVLIPESRGDIMGLIGSLDKIIGVFEDIFATIQIQRIEAPEFVREDLAEVVDVSVESCDHLRTQVEQFLRGETGIRKSLAIIDANESRCDYINRRILKRVFDSDLDPFFKLQFKELIEQISQISDRAELVARHVNIISLKRRV